MLRLRKLQAQLALASIGVGLLLLNLIFLLLAWHLPAVRATLFNHALLLFNRPCGRFYLAHLFMMNKSQKKGAK